MSDPMYDIARDLCFELGLTWTDPRTGKTYPPPKLSYDSEMTKISWTCPTCGMWHSVPETDLPETDGRPVLICRRCAHDATAEMVADEPVAGIPGAMPVQSITYRRKSNKHGI